MRQRPQRQLDMLDFLLDNLHLIEVDFDATFCETQGKASASFRSLRWYQNGRPWNVKGESRERLIAAIEREMAKRGEWIEGE